MTIVPPEQRPDHRMLPNPTAWSQAFWTAGESGRLLIHRCNTCTRFFHPPAPVCFRCRSTDVAPTPVSGRAAVATFTIDRHQWLAGFPPPYVVAIVELDEGPLMLTNIVDCEPDEIEVGARVRVTYLDASDDITLYPFVLDRG